MSVLDIRKGSSSTIDTIVFSGDGSIFSNTAAFLTKGGNTAYNDAQLLISNEGWGPEFALPLYTKEDALNLAKALQTAVELGWFE